MNSAIQAGADSRDMIGAHVSYRREFGAVPQIVSAVAADDTARAAVVAAHIQLIVNQLHAHHTSEDDGVWPKLHERCPAELEPLVVTMEEQHLSLDRHLRELETSAQRWAAQAPPRTATPSWTRPSGCSRRCTSISTSKRRRSSR